MADAEETEGKMNTMAMNQETVEKIASKLSEKAAKKIAVRTASINKRTGRCLFDFEDAGGNGLAADMVAIAVVFSGAKQTGQFYVIPGQMCPKKLLLKPGSPSSKWNAYYCGSAAKLTDLIERTVAFRPSQQLLERIG